MGKKYIIELEEPEIFDERKFYTCTQMPWWAVSEKIVENLTPYTEPDLEHVKADAYLAGLKDGQGVTIESQQNNAFNDGYKKCLKDLEQVEKKAYDEGYMAAYVKSHMETRGSYQQGLNDAWEAAKKIWDIDMGSLSQLFGKPMRMDIYVSFTAAEVIEKLKAYEQEKEFKAGDEFENESGKKFVVLKMNEKEIDRYMDDDGNTYHMNVKYKVMRKTGRHFPEIDAVLEKMRGENND